jgi:hypothetical protein
MKNSVVALATYIHLWTQTPCTYTISKQTDYLE